MSLLTACHLSMENKLLTEESQSTNQVLMVRPHKFRVNTQTLSDNAFQQICSTQSEEEIENRAYLEVTQAIAILRSLGVKVKVFEDRTGNTPDSVFPNNWFSTHNDGTLNLYPMLAQNRRLERKKSIIRFLTSRNTYNQLNDYSQYEHNGKILEGTGSVIFDHIHNYFYVARSHRTSDELINKLASSLGMQPIVFDTEDESGKPIYHTNVIMGLGTEFVVICLDVLKNLSEKEQLLNHFKYTGKEVIPISWDQAKHFCGNVLELQGKHKKILALSSTAYQALNEIQKFRLQKYVYLQPIHVPTIEMAGGSIRCMIAELF
ncbi:citrulline utilization hydrolase CtlX [Vibrio quintilis]|uniref:citrulline utilization hydrolase CtlX n=1 Tax=Vibrio quintilis TaxID=1117707 RepID=UPI0021C67C69|nr:arginine deiminase-related protein [Vibrio quintilis]